MFSTATTCAQMVFPAAAPRLRDGQKGLRRLQLCRIRVGQRSGVSEPGINLLPLGMRGGVDFMPLSLSICQTDPLSGACTSEIGPSVTTTIDCDDTPTFSIFATAEGSIPFDPATFRIFIEFTESEGQVRGLEQRGGNDRSNLSLNMMMDRNGRTQENTKALSTRADTRKQESSPAHT